MKNTAKQLDFKSVLIGVLSSVLVFTLVGAKDTPKNLGDIVVNSIKVMDDGTGGGLISIHNNEGKQTVGFVNTKHGGLISIHNNEGTPTGILKNYEYGGSLLIFNKEGEATANLGSGKEGGRLLIFNKEGEPTVSLPE